MNDTTEILAGPAPAYAPGSAAAPEPETLAVITAAPRVPWYRQARVLALIAVLAAVVAGAVTAGLLYLTGGQNSATAVLKADGYTQLMTLSPSQFSQMAGPDGSALQQYITVVDVGTHGSSMEMVVGLSSAGRDYIGANMGALQAGLGSGLTGHMQDGYLVVDGPMGS
jgi:hypothetical protein